MAMDSFGIYLNDIGAHPLLTAGEELSLAVKIRDGRAAQERVDSGSGSPADRRAVAAGRAAFERFYLANLRLVVAMAKRYPLPTGVTLGDLVQEGNLGLWRAVEKFDPDRGYKFSTYATWWIRKSISSFLDVSGPVSVPVNRAAEVRTALRRVDDVSDLPEEMAVVERALSAVSLDAVTGEGDEPFGAWFSTGDDVCERVTDAITERELVATIFGMLGDVDAYVVCRRFGLDGGGPTSWTEIGETLGVSRQAVEARFRGVCGRVVPLMADVYGDGA